MKQNCHFDRGLAQYKHATPPLRFSGIITTLLGFPKRYITLVYLKGLKSYQPSKFKRVDFLSFYLVKRTFRLHFYWQLLSPLRYTKVIYLFGKPRSVVIMPEKVKGGIACLCCARPLTKWQFCFINRQACGFIRSLLYVTMVSTAENLTTMLTLPLRCTVSIWVRISASLRSSCPHISHE